MREAPEIFFFVFFMVRSIFLWGRKLWTSECGALSRIHLQDLQLKFYIPQTNSHSHCACKLGAASSASSSEQKLVLRLEILRMGLQQAKAKRLHDLGATCTHSLKILMVFVRFGLFQLQFAQSGVWSQKQQKRNFQFKSYKSIGFPCCWGYVWRTKLHSAIPATLLEKFVYIGGFGPPPLLIPRPG